jgi:hypothetical protein
MDYMTLKQNMDVYEIRGRDRLRQCFAYCRIENNVAGEREIALRHAHT